ncbi:MAG: L,D-transpeptidase family protein [Myxococcales bacterium]|nr:L,D-transpeptidase family protein [Myxococcales bacterium]
MNGPGRAVFLLVWLSACAGSEGASVRPPPLDPLPESLAAVPPPSLSITPTEDEPPPIRRREPDREPIADAYPVDDLENLLLRVQPESVRESVRDVYVSRGGTFLWSDGLGLTPAAEALVRLVNAVPDHGIRPEVIGAGIIENLAHAASWCSELLGELPKRAKWGFEDFGARANLARLRLLLTEELDIRLTGAALALVRLLGLSEVGGRDLAALLERDEGRLAFVESLVPRSDRYERLVKAHGRYRAMNDFEACSGLAGGATLTVGRRDPRVPCLRRRLEAEVEGLAGVREAPVDGERRGGDVYDERLAWLLRRFQDSRGLSPSGALDEATITALDVPRPALVDQIRAAMRAVRGSGTRGKGTYVLVNIPEFTAELVVDDEVRRRHRVVVGYPYGTGGGRTKLLTSSIERVVVNPGWTPSDGILQNELLPKEKADPGYLQREGFRRFVRPNGQEGYYQLPGDRNALGRVTLNFENQNFLYLHGTPDETAFGFVSRALSHGCVRVQDVEAFALDVLDVAGGMTAAEFERALDSRRKAEVRLDRPVPIAIDYYRVVVADDGLVRFLPNIYRF